MKRTEFSYKGKTVVIEEDHPDAVVRVDSREFRCHHHHEEAKDEEAKRRLPMWMCAESYFASPDIKELARHFVDYGYMFDDPGRVVVNDEGEVVKVPAREKKKVADEPDDKSNAAHRHGGHSRKKED